MKKLILVIIAALALTSVGFAAEKSLAISLYEPVSQTLEVTTTDVLLSTENWQRELENALKNHFVVAKEVAEVIFPDCKKFSTTLSTKIAVGFLPTFTAISQIKCSQPSP